MKELRVEVRLRNNRLIRLRENLRLGARQMAERIGVGYANLLKLEALKLSPLSKRREEHWTKTALKIAAFHGVAPSYLWPESVQAIETPRAVIELSTAQARALVDGDTPALGSAPVEPEVVVQEAELTLALEAEVRKLPPREARIIIDSFGLHGRTALGTASLSQKYGLTRSRIQQVRHTAINRLRKDSSRRLAEHDDVTAAAVKHEDRARDDLRGYYESRKRLSAKTRRILPSLLRDFTVRDRLRVHELRLRRYADWCCMNPFCESFWPPSDLVGPRADAARECCGPCRELLLPEDPSPAVLGNVIDDLHPDTMLAVWARTAAGERMGLCFGPGSAIS